MCEWLDNKYKKYIWIFIVWPLSDPIRSMTLKVQSVTGKWPLIFELDKQSNYPSLWCSWIKVLNCCLELFMARSELLCLFTIYRLCMNIRVLFYLFKDNWRTVRKSDTKCTTLESCASPLTHKLKMNQYTRMNLVAKSRSARGVPVSLQKALLSGLKIQSKPPEWRNVFTVPCLRQWRHHGEDFPPFYSG